MKKNVKDNAASIREEYKETGVAGGEKKSQLSFGLLVIILGAAWAVYELIKSVMYFFI